LLNTRPSCARPGLGIEGYAAYFAKADKAAPGLVRVGANGPEWCGATHNVRLGTQC
jgi:hypothetical protein